MNHIAVITTVGNVDEARRLARTVVERRLAACAHVSEVESFYIWKNALENDHEYRVVFKTTQDQYDAIERAIKELHSYELPAIYATKLDRVYAPYAAWLDENSDGGATGATE